jgi:putative membrane protein
MSTTHSTQDKPSIEIPSQSLLTYYFLSCLIGFPVIFITFPIMWIRFKTLRYELQESGIRMSVGLLFRKEVIVAYRRIQDIHVSNNIFQRWLGISSVSIQTASGNSMPEIVVEGVQAPDQLRDWLYERTRGAKTGNTVDRTASPSDSGKDFAGSPEQVTELLKGIRDNLASLAEQSAASKQSGGQV